MIEAANEVQQEQTQSNALDWIAAAGGPAVKWDGRHQVKGLPEVWHSYSDDGSIGLHTNYTEPNSGASGTVMVSLIPAEDGLRWEACFLLDEVKGQAREVFCRTVGRVADFNQAHALASAWRPVCVVVATGEQVWGAHKGVVGGFNGGSLRFNNEDGAFNWKLDVPGMEKINEVTGGWVRGVQGQSAGAGQMVRDAKLKLAELKGAMAAFVLGA